MTVSNPSPHDAELQAALERALDSGVTELPPNRVKGLLGEKGPDLRKTDDFAPDLNAGISQEMDLPVVWMGIVLAYVLFFPLAFVLLWRSRHITRRAKTMTTIVGVAGIAAVGIRLFLG